MGGWVAGGGGGGGQICISERVIPSYITLYLATGAAELYRCVWSSDV